VNRTAGRPPTVTSNGLPIPLDDATTAPLPDSSDLIEDADALREVLRERGVVWLRGVLDPGSVWDLRADYFGRFPSSYLAPGTTAAEGVYSGTTPADLPAHGMVGHPAHSFVRGGELACFLDRSPLAGLAATMLGGRAEMLPRVILRHFDAESRRSSRAHTDYAYMDRGTAAVVTMWVPIGDCPVESGGIVYLEDSHRIAPARLDAIRGVTDRPGDDRPLSHDLAWVARALGRRWLWADYQAGDVVLHGPHIVHASLDTTTPAMRMSVDVRFMAAEQQPDDRWLRPWSADDGA
jgi:hypothetical protein